MGKSRENYKKNNAKIRADDAKMKKTLDDQNKHMQADHAKTKKQLKDFKLNEKVRKQETKQSLRAIRAADKHTSDMYKNAQKKEAEVVINVMRKHFQVMLKNDPEWQMIARRKTKSVLPAKEWENQFLEVNMCGGSVCPMKRISGVAIQADPEHFCWVSHFKISYSLGHQVDGVWTPNTWQFYSAKEVKHDPKKGPPSILNSGDVIEGNHPSAAWETRWSKGDWSTNLESDTVVKTMLSRAFDARFVRIHPVCWHGPYMAMRVEIYTESKGFDWGPLQQKPALHCNGPPSRPGILDLLGLSFAKWTDGLDGSGAVFQSPAVDIKVGAGAFRFKAFQRRVIKNKGMLIKKLICRDALRPGMKTAKKKKKKQSGEEEDLGESAELSDEQLELMEVGGGATTCCVSKNSTTVGGHWPEQKVETKLF